jgi:hypothetical protein
MMNMRRSALAEGVIQRAVVTARSAKRLRMGTPPCKRSVAIAKNEGESVKRSLTNRRHRNVGDRAKILKKDGFGGA